jgi:hypothetical protein
VSLAPDAPIAGRVSQTQDRNAAHCPGRPLQRQGHPEIVSKPLRRNDLRDPPLSAGASADPAGLTARARPEARPDRRAANVHTTGQLWRLATGRVTLVTLETFLLPGRIVRSSRVSDPPTGRMRSGLSNASASSVRTWLKRSVLFSSVPERRGHGPMGQHWEYLSWSAYVAVAIGAWRFLPLAIVRLVAAFTRDERRHRQCMEVLRLSRRDAALISRYISELPSSRRSRPSTPITPDVVPKRQARPSRLVPDRRGRTSI